MKAIIILITFIPLFARSQDTTSHFSAGVFASADLCYRRSVAEDGFELMKAEFDSLELFRVGYSAGLALNYDLRENLFLASGIQFSDRGYRIDTLKESRISDIRYHYQQVEVPVRIGLRFNYKGRTKPFVSVGLVLGGIIGQKTTMNRMGEADDIEHNGLDQSVNRFQTGILFTAGIQKEFYHNYVVRIEAMGRQSINSVSNTNLNRMLNSVGTGLTFLHHF